MILAYNIFTKQDINLIKELLSFFEEIGNRQKDENIDETIYNFEDNYKRLDIYKRYGYKNENEIQSFSAKLCNADLAIPWHINHEENIFGMEGIEKYKVDEMKEFIRLWEDWDKRNFYNNIRAKILDVMTIIMFIEFIVRIVCN